MKTELRYLISGFALIGFLSVSTPLTSARSGAITPSGTVASAASASGVNVTFLPFVVRAPGSIFGHLNQSGIPAGGISLELSLDNGSTDSTVATTTTDSSGYYAFVAPPSLSAGQSYSVEYMNSEQNSARMMSWSSKDITSYVSDASVDLGTSDLADMPLVAPSSGAVVTLPYLFQWTRRPATPSDSYVLIVFDPIDLNPFGMTPFLGFASSVHLTSLSSGFSAGVPYAWCLGLWDAAGGIGISYGVRWITFTNTGNAAASSLNVSSASRDRLLKRLRLSHPREQ